MCLCPIIIENKTYRAVLDRHNPLSLGSIRDSSSFQNLKVGCGHCVECQGLKQSYYSQRASLMARDHYVFFQTLTLNERSMKYLDINGYRHRYFDIRYFQNYIKILRKYDVFHADFKYFAVTEYGGQSHRPHMHILYFVPKNSEYWSKFESLLVPSLRDASISAEAGRLFYDLLSYWRVNLGSSRNPLYDNLLDFVSKKSRRNYDFTFVPESDTSRVMYYVTKYMLKYDDWIVKKQMALKLNLSAGDYKLYWSYLKPHILVSKNFGSSSSYTPYVRGCFRRGFVPGDANPRAYFYDANGRRSVMSPYLVRKHLTSSDTLDLFFSQSEDPSRYCDDPKGYDYSHRQQHADFVNKHLKYRSVYYDRYESDIFQDDDFTEVIT